MRIKDKKKFIVRISQIIIIVASIILTIFAVNYANTIRGYAAIGGEFLIILLGLIVSMVIEALYQESKGRRKNNGSNA